MRSVFMVLRQGRDTLPYMVEIIRVCSTRDEAMRVRQEVFESHKLDTVVQCFMVQQPEVQS